MGQPKSSVRRDVEMRNSDATVPAKFERRDAVEWESRSEDDYAKAERNDRRGNERGASFHGA